MKEDGPVPLGIERIQTHFYCCENLEFVSAKRDYALIRCDAGVGGSDLERLFLEFHHESIAVRFHEEMKGKRASISMRKEGDTVHQTAGIKRFVLMYPDRVCAFGFKGEEKPCRDWMDSLGFQIGNRIIRSH